MLIYVLTIIAMTFASLLFVFEPESNIPDWPTALWLTVVSMTGLGLLWVKGFRFHSAPVVVHRSFRGSPHKSLHTGLCH